MFEEEEDDTSTMTAVRYQCMPSLVALQLMRNRLHLAYLGRKLMKWSAIATGRELRRIAMALANVYQSFGEEMKEAYMVLARARYFCPDMNNMVLANPEELACVTVETKFKPVVGCKLHTIEIIESGAEPYPHLGMGGGGRAVHAAKLAWLALLRRLAAAADLRRSFAQLEAAYTNANKKQNMLSKILIPRVGVTMSYIISEMEEQAREETFRLKRVKQYIAKRAQKVKAAKEPINEKEENIDCACPTQNISKPTVVECSPSKKSSLVKSSEREEIQTDKQDLQHLLLHVDECVQTITKRLGPSKSTEKFIEEYKKFKGSVNRFTASVPPQRTGSIPIEVNVKADQSKVSVKGDPNKVSVEGNIAQTGDSAGCSCHTLRETTSECLGSTIAFPEKDLKKTESPSHSKTESGPEVKKNDEGLCPMCYEKVAQKRTSKSEMCSKVPSVSKKLEETNPHIESCPSLAKNSQEKKEMLCTLCAQRVNAPKESKSDYHKRCLPEEFQREKSSEKSRGVCGTCQNNTEKTESGAEEKKNKEGICPICYEEIAQKSTSNKSEETTPHIEKEQTPKVTKSESCPSLAKSSQEKKEMICSLCAQRLNAPKETKSDYHKRCLPEEFQQVRVSAAKNHGVCGTCQNNTEKRERKPTSSNIESIQRSALTEPRFKDAVTSTTGLDVKFSKTVTKKAGKPIKIVPKSSSSHDSVSASSECSACKHSRSKSVHKRETSPSLCKNCRNKSVSKKSVSESDLCPKCQMIQERKVSKISKKCPMCSKEKEAKKVVCPKCRGSVSNESSISEYQGKICLSPEKSKCLLCGKETKDNISVSSSSAITGSILAYLRAKLFSKDQKEEQKSQTGCILCKRPFSKSAQEMKALDFQNSYPKNRRRDTDLYRPDPYTSDSDENCCGTQTSKTPTSKSETSKLSSCKYSCKFDETVKVAHIDDSMKCVGEPGKTSKSSDTKEVGVNTKMADRFDVRPVHMLANAMLHVRCVCAPENPSKVCYCVSEPICHKHEKPVRKVRSLD